MTSRVHAHIYARSDRSGTTVRAQNYGVMSPDKEILRIIIVQWAHGKVALPKKLPLKISQRHITHQCEQERQLISNIPTIVPNHDCNHSGIPRLHHTQHTAHNSQGESHSTCIPHRHKRRSIPSLEVVIRKVSLAEEVVLGEKDNEEGCVPVAEESEEVLQHEKQLVPASNGKGHDGTKNEESLDKARYGLKWTGELLHREGCGIEGYAVRSH